MQRIVCFVFLVLFLLPSVMVKSQGTREAYQFLGVPASSHVAALGGHNISLPDDDATLFFSNPALLTSVSDKSLALGYTSFVAKYATAAFARQSGERGNWAVGAQYCDYGKMVEASETGERLGDITAKDIALCGAYSYNLSDCFVGGVTAKFITSNYASYSSVAVCVDLGLSYFDDENNFTASLVVKNLGGQVKAFDDVRETLPSSLQLGFTKRMAHAPFRVSVTLIDLNHWSRDYYYRTGGTGGSFKSRLFKHFVFGVDLLPSDNIYIGIGYNPRRNSEMKVADSSHGAGWSFGGGLSAGRISLGLAYSKLHASASSLLCNFSVKL